jgi:putative transposase
MSLAKQYSGYEHTRRTERRLWQPYGYEHVLQHDESLTRTVRYVIENPVRKGLVEQPRDYPFLGSSRYSVKELIEFADEARPA